MIEFRFLEKLLLHRVQLNGMGTSRSNDDSRSRANAPNNIRRIHLNDTVFIYLIFFLMWELILFNDPTKQQ